MSRSLTKQLLEKVNCHMGAGGGGVRKVPKKCHVLFDWPLTEFTTEAGDDDARKQSHVISLERKNLARHFDKENGIRD